MSSPADQALQPGQLRFVADLVPGLRAADYVLDARQTVTTAGVTHAEDSFHLQQVFSVDAARFALGVDEVVQVFPPANAQGIFDQYLPHVVLATPTTPWARAVSAPAAAADVDAMPWLALLVLDAGATPAELQLPHGSSPTGAVNSTLAELLAAAGTTVAVPDLEPEWYEPDTHAIALQTVDISPAAFAAVMPSLSDAQLLTHVRQIDVSAKDTKTLGINGDGWYSVIVGNRLPPGEPGTTRQVVVHLVSLEGWEQRLAAPRAFPPGVDTVRLVSLASWRYTCLPDAGESFSELGNGLLFATDGRLRDLALRLASMPASGNGAAAQAADALRRGYFPLAYQTRPGEETFAWYRGPISPIGVTSFVRGVQHPAGSGDLRYAPWGTASAAAAYDPATGVFDLSYASAWETGRLLGLADATFSAALAAWQRAGHQLLDVIAERGGQVPEAALLAELQHEALNPATGDVLADVIAHLAGQAPPAPTSRARTSVRDPDTKDDLSIADVLKLPGIADLVREIGGRQLEPIAEWLAARYLLEGIPFQAIVPHESLLPAETLAFGQLDVNWLDTMIAGALSSAITTSRDVLYQDLLGDLIWDTTMAAIQARRAALLGEAWIPAVLPPASSPPPMGAMLLRSALVSGWPGLEVHAFANGRADAQGVWQPDTNTEIRPLRIDRVADDLLLCLWPTTPALVCLDEPHEGIAFGIVDPPPDEHDGTWVDTRSLNRGDGTYGMPTTHYERLDACIAGATRVFDVGALSRLLGGTGALEAHELALQMVKVPERILVRSGAAHG
ncbi:MAG TPA: hypothetical protein VFZ89_17710 [Solirubrobacteraceae bacterium]